MTIRDQNRRTLWPAWQVAISLLLIGVVLYNPFMGLFHAGDRPSYDKLARNRATVGSSELQHYSPAPELTERAIPNVEYKSAEPLQPMEEEHRVTVQPEVKALQPEGLAGIWFRPPPAQ